MVDAIVASVAATIVVAGCAFAVRKLKRALRRLGRYLEERMAEIAARIADPIVEEVGHLRRSMERTARTVSEAEAACRMDREAIWTRIGGRPHPGSHT